MGQKHIQEGVTMSKETIKKRIKDAENKIGVGRIDSRNTARVYWGPGELYAWYLSSGEVEKLTEEEYVARGGLLITWADD